MPEIEKELREINTRLSEIEAKLLPDFLTEKQLCQKIKITGKTAKSWRDNAGLPHVIAGGSIRYNISDVREWLVLNRPGKQYYQDTFSADEVSE